MDQFTMAEFAKNSENKEGSSFTPAVQEEGIEQGSLIVSRLYNTMLGEITRALKSWNAELTKILEEADITPSSLSNEQLYTAITKMINQSSGHMIGEIVNSPIPLVSAGMHLLDGSLITGDGVYAEFVDYIAELYAGSNPAPSYFTTESAWQTSVSQYGVCSKFVYDANNNTVRLPKLYSTERYLIDSYSNGDAWYRVYSDGWCEQGNLAHNTGGDNSNFSISLLKPYTDTNYFISQQLKRYGNDGSSGSGWNYWKERYTDHFTVVAWGDGRILWSTQGYTNISAYNVIPLYQYIALTQAPRTDIQIDVDNIITELNGKVDKSSLEEVHCVVETYNSGTSWYRIYDDGWCEQGGRIIGSNETDVTFLQEFRDTNYSLNIQQITVGSTSASYFGAMKAYALTTTGFHYKSGQSENPDVSWTACGYIN